MNLHIIDIDFKQNELLNCHMKLIRYVLHRANEHIFITN